MAGPKTTTTTGGKRAAAPEPANDRDEVSLADLARGILAKEIRPRTVDIRRLAEAVLAGGGAKPKKAKKDKKDKAESGKKKDKSKKKLAKIPGQRAKN